MQIITKNTNDLKPYERNTKKHDSTQIANVGEKAVLINGNGRGEQQCR